jgi:hypothetical protein
MGDLFNTNFRDMEKHLLDDAGGVDLTTISREDLQPFDNELLGLYNKAFFNNNPNFKSTGVLLGILNLRKSLMRDLK